MAKLHTMHAAGNAHKENSQGIKHKHSAYKYYAKQEQLKHKTVSAKDYVEKNDKKAHLQHVKNPMVK